jgi:uncharacterized protein YdhG (YjbR/CyaY superfamily)
MKASEKKFTTIDEYIKLFPLEVRLRLNKIRELIKITAPKATEGISYGIPVFNQNGKYLIYFAGYKNHISIYPIPRGDDAFRLELLPYIKGKGTLQFPLSEPIPFDLITKVIKQSIEDNLSKTEKIK